MSRRQYRNQPQWSSKNRGRKARRGNASNRNYDQRDSRTSDGGRQFSDENVMEYEDQYESRRPDSESGYYQRRDWERDYRDNDENFGRQYDMGGMQSNRGNQDEFYQGHQAGYGSFENEYQHASGGYGRGQTGSQQESERYQGQWRNSQYGDQLDSGNQWKSTTGTSQNFQRGWGNQGGYGQQGRYGGDASTDYSSELMTQDDYGQGGRGPHFGKGPKNYRRSDDRIMEDINECLTRNGQIDASEIDVQVASGEVTLSGTVDSRQTKRLAEDLAEEVFGVREVSNQIRVKRADDENSGSIQSTEEARAKGTRAASRSSAAV